MEDKELTTKDVYAKMATVCSRSEQCSYDVRNKILNAGLSSDEADEMIEKLIAERYINDERYIRSYVSDKFKLNKWGKVKIRHYLKMKRFSDDLIQQGLDSINEDKYRLALLKTMKEKARSVKNKSRYEKMGQIIRFAQNRGFEPELIHRYLHEVVE
ncbi:MAG: regulatory protein RecX [Mariniphaga sp.]